MSKLSKWLVAGGVVALVVGLTVPSASAHDPEAPSIAEVATEAGNFTEIPAYALVGSPLLADENERKLRPGTARGIASSTSVCWLTVMLAGASR